MSDLEFSHFSSYSKFGFLRFLLKHLKLGQSGLFFIDFLADFPFSSKELLRVLKFYPDFFFLKLGFWLVLLGFDNLMSYKGVHRFEIYIFKITFSLFATANPGYYWSLNWLIILKFYLIDFLLLISTLSDDFSF